MTDAILSTMIDKRSRRTKAEIEALKALMHGIIRESRPMTVRQVF